LRPVSLFEFEPIQKFHGSKTSADAPGTPACPPPVTMAPELRLSLQYRHCNAVPGRLGTRGADPSRFAGPPRPVCPDAAFPRFRDQCLVTERW